MDSSKNTIDHQFYRNTVGIFRRSSRGNKSIGPVNCGLNRHPHMLQRITRQQYKHKFYQHALPYEAANVKSSLCDSKTVAAYASNSTLYPLSRPKLGRASSVPQEMGTRDMFTDLLTQHSRGGQYLFWRKTFTEWK